MGSILTQQNEPVNQLIYITNGNVEVVKDNKRIAKFGVGYLIGEMSVISKNNATATVTAATDLECLVWNLDTLNKLEKKDPNLFLKLKHALTMHLMKKIDQQAQIATELDQ